MSRTRAGSTEPRRLPAVVRRAGALALLVLAVSASLLRSGATASLQPAAAPPWAREDFLALPDRPSDMLGSGWTTIGTSRDRAGEATSVRSASLSGPDGQQLGITVFETSGDVASLGELIAAATDAYEEASSVGTGERPLPDRLAAALPGCTGGLFSDGDRRDAAAVVYEAHALCPLDRFGIVLLAYRGVFADAGQGANALATLLDRADPAPEALVEAWPLPTGAAPSGRFLGRADAPVTVQVWGDYQSPGSRNFARLVLPQLVSEFAVQGDVRIEALDHPILGNESILAAMAAECAAEQDRFWDLHLLLFANRDTEPESGAFTRPRLSGMAEMAGLDGGRFAACMDGDGVRRAMERSAAEADAAGVTAVPALVVNGSQVPWQGWDALAAAVEDALADSESQSGSTPVTGFTATIRDGSLEPSRVTVPAGARIVMTVKGDQGTHRLEIPGVVAARDIPPGRATSIAFEAPEDPGRRAVLLDGELAAELVVGPGTSGDSDAALVVELDALDIYYEPRVLEIPAGRDVRLVVVNRGAAPHSVLLGGDPNTADPVAWVDLAPGDRRELTVNLPPGTYTFWCSVPGHRQAGMVGTLVAR